MKTSYIAGAIVLSLAVSGAFLGGAYLTTQRAQALEKERVETKAKEDKALKDTLVEVETSCILAAGLIEKIIEWRNRGVSRAKVVAVMDSSNVAASEIGNMLIDLVYDAPAPKLPYVAGAFLKHCGEK
jgi:hypothetical protein